MQSRQWTGINRSLGVGGLISRFTDVSFHAFRFVGGICNRGGGQLVRIQTLWLAIIVVLLYSYSGAASAETPQAAAFASDVSLANVAKIKAGHTTREQITELLGPPYRMTNYGDCSPIDYQEFWEYVGHDTSGIFKIHIEFDDAGIARIIAKDSKKGPIIVLDAAPKPEKQHQHSSSGS
jgi:outer membrane protein assembly factor BamE (lipoprotein component of BamABCDE complex)